MEGRTVTIRLSTSDRAADRDSGHRNRML